MQYESGSNHTNLARGTGVGLATLRRADVGIGLVIGIFQATTQIQEQTLTYVPKLTGVFTTIAIIGPWVLAQAVKFTAVLMNSIAIVR